VTFASLQPGAYTFEVIAINADNVESAVPAAFTFIISPPFWQRWWFIAFCVLILGGILYAIHVVRLDRLLEIEKIRARIATDLHDDIGAGLTHIGLLSQVALHKKGMQQFYTTDKEKTPQMNGLDLQTAAAAIHELGGSVERMGGVARELSAAMSDVVWSINPQHDSGEALQRRLSVFAHEICRAKNIALNFAVSDQMAGIKLHPELRRNLLLIAKEALHNAVKYSGSPNVSVNIDLNDKNIIVEIADCGKGFEISNSSTGNGLNNMRSRAEKLGGACEIVSAPGQGTRVAATVPYKKG
jgi:signal transduction histidine kinase